MLKSHLGLVCCASLALATAHPCRAEIIPAGRRMLWEPGVTVGVPGGIPQRTTIFVNVRTTENPAYRCAGDGMADDSARLEAALKACPPGQVVYVPAGTYRLDNRVYVYQSHNFTLRGDGQGRTAFLCKGGRGQLLFGTHQWPHPTGEALPVTGGATVGSTILKVTETRTVNVGNLATLWMDTPTWMHTLNGTDAGIVLKMTLKVVAKTTDTVTVTPPIPFDVSRMNPKIIPWGNSGGGRVLNGVGLEGFTIDATEGSGFPIWIQQAWGCWVKDVEILGSRSRQIFLTTVGCSEIRECYTHDVQGGGPNHEGVDLQSDCCWNLVENNTCVNGGFPAIILGDAQGGCVGNVIAYNYIDRVNTGSSVAGAGLSDSHGAGGNTLNLYEGNVSQGFASDGYFGGSSHGTLFRNFIHNRFLPQDGKNNQGPVAVMLDHYAVYYNIVGNVLGSPEMKSEYESDERAYRVRIYRLGFPNMGNCAYGGGTEGLTIGPTTPPDYRSSPNRLADAQALDLNVKATLLRHGNFDYATNSVIWDPAIAERVLPPSLYLKQKPAWWDDSRWPAVGPDLDPMVGSIPAQARLR